jgi:hypothetical protein
MFGLFYFLLTVLASSFKSKSRLEAENAALRHQLIVLRRKVHGRVRLTNNDRWFFVQLCSSCRPLVSTCSMPLSLFDSIADSSSGSTSQQIPQQNGLRAS